MPKIQDAHEVPSDKGPSTTEELLRYGKQGQEFDSSQSFAADSDELEKFMHETVYVTVHESLLPGDIMAIPIHVGENVQYVVRGVRTPVKRKYIEVLARARTTRWEQVQTNMFDPASSRPMPKTALSYPFATHEDSPKGNAWLRAILAQPA